MAFGYDGYDPYARAIQAAQIRGQGGGATSPGTQMPGRGGGGGGQYTAAGADRSNPMYANNMQGSGKVLGGLLKKGGSKLFGGMGSGGMGAGGAAPSSTSVLGNMGMGADFMPLSSAEMGGFGNMGIAPGTEAAGLGGEATGGGNWFTSLFGGGSGGGAAGGGGGSAGSSLASFWPAAVVIAAIANEVSANKSNYNWTDEEGNEHKDPLRPNGWKDTLTGESAHYDAERRWVPWLNELTGGDKETGKPGWSEKYKINDLVQFGGDLGSPGRWDDIISNGWRELKGLF